MAQDQAEEGRAPDVAALEEQLPSQAAAVHAVIRRSGEKELRREVMALLWSAIAGGITMSTSFLGRGVLMANLPQSDFGFLIDSAGYTLGFLFVIAAGQQLFTENTVTPVLPFMSNPTRKNLACLLRLWGVVLLGNTIGGAIAAAVFAWMPVFPGDVMQSFVNIGAHMLEKPWPQMLAGGVISGWLIATMVWAIHAEPRAKMLLVFLATYLIAIGEFPHVIVGTIEALFMLMLGQANLLDVVFGFWLPTLIGNVLGGTFIFALISHAQVRADVDAPRRKRA
ncbi:formate/nitrite transporter family protein [Pseudooceanicola sp. CBS1P-1]|uniref:Formate transporter n=1 Tax=Pseudooceanicola albus TaxID=2692189 RepID=A0A6L7FZC4_9RHOB|nr:MULTISPECIES: formate/nitrite transporter family protein [Pseudooceanicola]MBT9383927.1 formate/nitrite transporter family protein [Pseudooceanicola endophyticus]MXN16660.1 formate transporter [Pseudooceanicola albus]